MAISGAEIVELLGNRGEIIDMTVANETAISKGTLMALSDPRTGTANTGNGQPFAGIASADKEITDGAVNLGVHTKGIFDLTVESGSPILAGDWVKMSGANTIAKVILGSDLSKGAVVGKALEDASADEVIEVAVGVY